MAPKGVRKSIKGTPNEAVWRKPSVGLGLSQWRGEGVGRGINEHGFSRIKSKPELTVHGGKRSPRFI